MIDFNWAILAVGGLISGVISGLLGIGGGILTIPLMVALGYTPVQAIATSSLFITITAISGSIQNWLMGYFDWKKVFYLGIPAFLLLELEYILPIKFHPKLSSVPLALFYLLTFI